MAARKRIAARRDWPKNLYQNSDGYLWFRHPETKKTAGLGRDLKLAIAKARLINAKIDQRRAEQDLMERLQDGGVTLAAWCDEFEEEYRADPARKSSTLKTVGYQLNAIRSAPFAGKSLPNVTTLDISTWLKEQAKTHPTMTALVRSRLMAVFRAAEARGHIGLGKNPVTPTDKPRVIVTRARLTLDDFNAILAKVREAGLRWMENAMLLGLVTGQRREDLTKLRFAQVHDGFLWIVQGKGKTGHESKLMIPIDIGLPAVNMTIDDVVKQCRDAVVSKYIVHHVRAVGMSKPGMPVTTDSLSTVFAQYRDLAEIKMGVDKTPTTFHEIRSLSARLYADAYGEEFAQALLGHKSGKMTALYRDSRGQEWTEVKRRAI